MIRYILLMLSFPLLTSCSNGGDNSEKCFLGVDQVHIIDSLTTKNTTYFLVHRLTGFQEKTEYLELYSNEPTFNDRCRYGDIEPVYGESLDESMVVKYVYLDTNHHTIEIVYYDENSKNINTSITKNRALKLELKPH